MGLVYVTGVCGAGKTTVCRELRRRGFDAHDTDEDGNARWVERASGAVVHQPIAAERTPEFLAAHDWCIDPARARAWALAPHAVILCGSVANDDVVWPLSEKVICLSIDAATLLDRLECRTSNDFGKSGHERDAIIGWHRTADEDYRGYGAVMVDATRALDEVVGDVLAAAVGYGA